MAINNFYSAPVPSTVNIANGQTTSAAIDLTESVLAGIHFPTITSTAVSFQAASTAAGTYRAMRKNGADYSEVIATDKYLILNPADFWGVQYLKIVMGSAEGASRDLVISAVKRV